MGSIGSKISKTKVSAPSQISKGMSTRFSKRIRDKAGGVANLEVKIEERENNSRSPDNHDDEERGGEPLLPAVSVKQRKGKREGKKLPALRALRKRVKIEDETAENCRIQYIKSNGFEEKEDKENAESDLASGQIDKTKRKGQDELMRISGSEIGNDPELQKKVESIFAAKTVWNITDFTIQCSIGTGGFSTVYKAIVNCNGGSVALKFVSQSDLEQLSRNKKTCAFLVESDLHRSFQHTNIVRALGFFRTTKHSVLVMEFCMGDMQDYLCGKGLEYSKTRSHYYIKQIADGITYLHLKAKILHLDLKLENILISTQDIPKITDFGFSIEMGALRTLYRNSRGGTRWYKPPEQLQHNHFDSTADIWAFGCIAFEMIMFYHPFFTTENMDVVGYESEADEKVALERMLAAKQGKFRNPERLARESEHFKNFVKSLLTYSRIARPTSRNLASITWLSSCPLEQQSVKNEK